MLIQLLDPAHHAWTVAALPWLLAGLALVGLGVWTLIRERGSEVSVAFWFLTSVTAIWLLAVGVYFMARDAETAFCEIKAGCRQSLPCKRAQEAP